MLAGAVVGVPLGAALMALPIPGPGSGALAVAGLMLLGLAMAALFLIRRPGRVASPLSP